MKEMFMNLVSHNMMLIVMYTSKINNRFINKAVSDVCESYCNDSSPEDIVVCVNQLRKAIIDNHIVFTNNIGFDEIDSAACMIIQAAKNC